MSVSKFRKKMSYSHEEEYDYHHRKLTIQFISLDCFFCSHTAPACVSARTGRLQKSSFSPAKLRFLCLVWKQNNLVNFGHIIYFQLPWVKSRNIFTPFYLHNAIYFIYAAKYSLNFILRCIFKKTLSKFYLYFL